MAHSLTHSELAREAERRGLVLTKPDLRPQADLDAEAILRVAARYWQQSNGRRGLFVQELCESAAYVADSHDLREWANACAPQYVNEDWRVEGPWMGWWP